MFVGQGGEARPRFARAAAHPALPDGAGDGDHQAAKPEQQGIFHPIFLLGEAADSQWAL